ncbi:MAG TPA: cellulase family glycosylhydrolase [Pseudobacteroides sp.]
MSIFGTINVSASTANTGMRNISAIDLVKEIRIGWNLGNTLDAPTETAWGNPRTTKAMIDKVKEMGFNALRLPVTWDTHVGAAPSYTIDQTWFNRVEEVVNYALDNNMYVILNLHHENKWLIPTYANEAQSKAQLIKIWEQIANRFKSYSDYLIFETMNEPRVEGSPNEWTGGTYENRDVINKFNLAAVNTIRATGGNNESRFIMVPPHAAAAMDVTLNDFIIPNNDSKVIVSIHAYSPYFFAMDINGTSSWGTSSDKSSLTSEFNALYNRFISKGRAVVIGEFGTIDKNNLSSRTVHAEYYAKEAAAKGIPVFWWDNGYYAPGKAETYALLSRSALTWYYPDIAKGLVIGAGGTPNSPTSTPTLTSTPTPTKTTSSPIPSGAYPEDINGDKVINMADVVLIALHFNAIASESNYDKKCDINNDGAINMSDVILLALKFNTVIENNTQTPVPSASPTIIYNGRFDFSDPQGPRCAWSGSNAELNFSGTQVSVTLKSTGENWFQAFIDGNAQTPFSVNSTTSTITLASGLTNGEHRLVLWKRTEASQGEVQFLGFNLGQGKLLAAPAPLERKIEFIGDSITCAYGNEGKSKDEHFTAKNENSYLSYAAITARSLNSSSNIVAWSGIGISQNYGGQAGPLMLERYSYTLPYSGVKWDFKNYVPQVVVINLGTNDFSTSATDKTKFITNYTSLVSQVRSNYPNSHIFCTMGPMLWGTGLESCYNYLNEIVNGFKSRGDSKVYLLEYPQQSESNGYGEDWHPSLKTHQLMADQLTAEIKSKLGW